MNILIFVAIKNPNELVIGVDESTVILVVWNTATVFGVNQLVVLTASKATLS